MNLLIGIQCEGIDLAAIKEMLNHQGLIFEEYVEGKDYTCIIKIHSDSISNNENVVIVDQLFSIEDVIVALSGKLEKNLVHPEVNGFELLLVEKIKNVFFKQDLPFVRKWFWPDFKQACFIMTHDIDRMSIPPINARKETPLFIKAFLYLKYYYLKQVKKVVKFTDYVDKITEIEKKYGVHSTFFFFPEYDDISSFISTIKKLDYEGFEVGVHSESTNYEELKSEKEIIESYLGKEIFGTRHHLLNFVAPTTWLYQEKLLDYDLTFYHNHEFGYRAGLCFPYRPLNTVSIIEIPTTFMDWTALDKNMTYSQIKEELTLRKEQIERHNGCLVLNFHNEYFNKLVFPHITKIFMELLESSKNDYWVATAKECADWWCGRETAKVDIRFENSKYTILSSYDNLPLVIEFEGDAPIQFYSKIDLLSDK